MSEAVIILLFLVTLGIAINQRGRIKELKEDMKRVEWWKEYYKKQYHSTSERRIELAHENGQLRAKLNKER